MKMQFITSLYMSMKSTVKQPMVIILLMLKESQFGFVHFHYFILNFFEIFVLCISCMYNADTHEPWHTCGGEKIT